RTVAKAATDFVVYAFKPVELPIGSPETGGRDERGQVGRRGVLYRSGKRTLPNRSRKAPRVLFQAVEIRGRIFRCIPRIGKPGRVMVADYRFFIAFGRAPSTAARRPVGEMPGEQKRIIRVHAGRNGPLQTERAHQVARFGFSQLAIGREVVPKEHWRVPPTA